MALGTMVSCADYYQDTTTYTGDAGSATNPYAVEDCYDFCAIRYDSIEQHYNFVKDIDFNQHDTYKYGINNVTIIRQRPNVSGVGKLYIHGKGFELRNLICMNYTTATFCYGSTADQSLIYFDNIDFVNFTFINCRDINTSQGKFASVHVARFTDCNFSIYLSNALLTFLCYTSVMVNCTLNISGTHACVYSEAYQVMMLGNRTTANGGTYGEYKQNCNFNFENLIIMLPSISGSTIINLMTGNQYLNSDTYASLINCYFTGNIKIIANTAISASVTMYLFGLRCAVTNCYWTASITFTNSSIINQKLRLSASSNLATSFIATPNITGFSSFEYGNNYKLLTDEQCRDPEYLQSIGFPVINITNGGE